MANNTRSGGATAPAIPEPPARPAAAPQGKLSLAPEIGEPILTGSRAVSDARPFIQKCMNARVGDETAKLALLGFASYVNVWSGFDGGICTASQETVRVQCEIRGKRRWREAVTYLKHVGFVHVRQRGRGLTAETRVIADPLRLIQGLPPMGGKARITPAGVKERPVERPRRTPGPGASRRPAPARPVQPPPSPPAPQGRGVEPPAPAEPPADACGFCHGSGLIRNVGPCHVCTPGAPPIRPPVAEPPARRLLNPRPPKIKIKSGLVRGEGVPTAVPPATPDTGGAEPGFGLCPSCRMVEVVAGQTCRRCSAPTFRAEPSPEPDPYAFRCHGCGLVDPGTVCPRCGHGNSLQRPSADYNEGGDP